jgi:hypothetical protein
MDLDELRLEWQQQFKRAADNTKVNLEMLRQVKISDSRRELQKPLSFEIFSAVVFFLFATYLILVSLRLPGNLKFSVPGFGGAALTIVYLVFSVIKISMFMKIDFFYTPVVRLQSEIVKLEMLMLRFRKIELLLLLPLAMTAWPVLMFTFHGIDLYVNTAWFFYL